MAKRVTNPGSRRVTNVDLADKLDALDTRLTVIESEARVAKWVLRVIGLLFGSVVTAIVSHWKGWTK